MSNKYPTTIYVSIEHDEDGDPFMVSGESLELHAMVNRSVEVAVYQLVEIGEIHALAEYVVTEKAKKS